MWWFLLLFLGPRVLDFSFLPSPSLATHPAWYTLGPLILLALLPVATCFFLLLCYNPSRRCYSIW